jgi:hypothetical protein
MFRPWRMIHATLVVLLAASISAKVHAAQSEKSTGTASSREEQARTEAAKDAADAARQLLLAMDVDKTGKISREEWMKFMEAEFDRLDTKHTGELDLKELTRSRVRVRPYVGK